jgi:hypothetical protein
MRLVERLVKKRDMQPPVDPVDAKVGEPQEQRGREQHVRPRFPSPDNAPRSLGDRVVELRVTANVADEPREGEEVEHRERFEGEHDFEMDLVLEESRMVLHC